LLVALLNSIVGAGTFRIDGRMEDLRRTFSGEPFEAISLVLGRLVFEGAGYVAFNDALRGIHRLTPDIASTLSPKDIKRAVVDFLSSRGGSGKTVGDGEAQAFIERLLAPPVVDYAVTRELLGCVLIDKAGTVELGPFTIFDFEASFQRFADVPLGGSVFLHANGRIRTAISVSVAARTRERAMECADELFRSCESLIRHLQGSSATGTFGIFYFGDEVWRRSLVAIGRQLQVSNADNGGDGSTAHVDSGVLAAMLSSDLWKVLFDGRASTDLRARMLRAVHWHADALTERALPTAFLKAAVALELLLVKRSRGPDGPSISQCLSAVIGALLGTGSDSRHVLQTVRHLYGIRSDVAHSGTASVGWRDFLALDGLIRKVLSCLAAPPFDRMTSLEDVYRHLGVRSPPRAATRNQRPGRSPGGRSLPSPRKP
jgi:hypothetical protein